MINPHPGLPELDYVVPASLDEASKFLADHTGQAKPFMGGTDCFVRLRDGAWKLQYLVDVKALPGMKQITFDPQKGLTIGAAVPMNAVAEFLKLTCIIRYLLRLHGQLPVTNCAPGPRSSGTFVTLHQPVTQRVHALFTRAS